MSEWSKLTAREMWDLIDSIYLQHQLKLEDLMSLLGIEHEEYLRLRKNNLPVPGDSVENFFRKFGQGSFKE